MSDSKTQMPLIYRLKLRYGHAFTSAGKISIDLSSHPLIQEAIRELSARPNAEQAVQNAAAPSEDARGATAYPLPAFLRGYRMLQTAAQDFVDKVDHGEAYSKRSYKAFKEALDAIAASKEGKA